MYRVTNISKDEQSFYYGKQGKWITVSPGESVTIKDAIKLSCRFEIKDTKDIMKIKKEVDKK